MNVLFQRFDINLDTLTDAAFVEAWKGKNLADATAQLRTAMLAKGYTWLESMVNRGGLPDSILVGCEGPDARLKEEFYVLAGRLKLPYTSGDAYMCLTLPRTSDATKD